MATSTRAIDCRTEHDWCERVLVSLDEAGYAVVHGVLDADAIAATRDALYRVSRLIDDEVGEGIRASSGDACLARLPMKYDPHFLALMQTPEMLAVVDRHLSPAAVLRYQIGSIYTPQTPHELRPPNGMFHQNFPHIEARHPVALDAALLVYDMSMQSAPLCAVPGSHRLAGRPSEAHMLRNEVSLAAPAGSMILIDGSLWHREVDIESEPNLFVSHQFTHPLIKPHFDYPCALGADIMNSLPDRGRHLLGWNFRLPAGLDEFYRSEDERPFVSSRLRTPALPE